MKREREERKRKEERKLVLIMKRQMGRGLGEKKITKERKKLHDFQRRNFLVKFHVKHFVRLGWLSISLPFQSEVIRRVCLMVPSITPAFLFGSSSRAKCKFSASRAPGIVCVLASPRPLQIPRWEQYRRSLPMGKLWGEHSFGFFLGPVPATFRQRVSQPSNHFKYPIPKGLIC